MGARGTARAACPAPHATGTAWCGVAAAALAAVRPPIAGLHLTAAPACLPPPPRVQLAPGLRVQLLAGNWWRAPFTATALNHCELFMLPAEEWHRVLRNHAELAAELEVEAARCVRAGDVAGRGAGDQCSVAGRLPGC